MQEHTTQVDDLQLVALPSAIGCAGLFVQFTLAEWRLPSVLDDATEVARELVRAVVDSLGGEGSASVPITVRLRLRGAVLAVEVEAGRAAPRLAMPPALAGVTSGVETLGSGGQLMWCELPLPSGIHATAVALPRRGPSKAARVAPSHAAEPPDVGLDVMQRILTSLNRDADQQSG